MVLADRDAALYRVYGRALISAGRATEAAALLQPLLPPCPMPADLARPGDRAAGTQTPATAWLGQATPHLPKESTIEQAALAEQWHAVGKTVRLGRPRSSGRGRYSSPLTARPDAGAELWNLQGRNALELGGLRRRGVKPGERSSPSPVRGRPCRTTWHTCCWSAATRPTWKRPESSPNPRSRRRPRRIHLSRHAGPQVYARLGQHDKSVASFRIAIAKDPVERRGDDRPGRRADPRRQKGRGG